MDLSRKTNAGINRKRKRGGIIKPEVHENTPPDLPADILTLHVFPFLDRTTWNGLSIACKDIYESSKRLTPPWPLGRFVVGGAIYSVAFSPRTADILAFGGAYGMLRILDRSTGKYKIFEGHRQVGVNSVAFSPDGTLLASASDDRTVRIWKVEDGTCLRVLKHPRAIVEQEQKVHSVAFSPDGKLIASGSEDGRVRLWRVQDGTITRIFRAAERNSIMCVCFSPDSKMIAFGGTDHTVRIKDLSDGTRFCLECDNSVNAIAFSDDGRRLAAGFRNQATVQLWDAQDDYAEAGTLSGHTSSVTSLVFAGESLVSGSEDSTIRRWTMVDESCTKASMKSHSRCILSIAVASDGQTLASGNITGSLCLSRL